MVPSPRSSCSSWSGFWRCSDWWSTGALVEAEQAARAGAGALSIEALRTGVIQVDASAAVTAVDRFMAAAGHPGMVVVADGVVTVRIHYQVPTVILGLVGINRLDVSAEAAAVNVGGVTRGAA
jgi:hypothetical protein